MLAFPTPPLPEVRMSPSAPAQDDFADREYNNRAMIPDFAPIIERWSEQALTARRRSAGALDLYYGGGPRENLDLFPAAGHGSPLLVFIHGGYWRALDKRDFSWVAPPFVERGISVAVLNYELAPAVTIETITLQVLRALEWLHRQAEHYGFDPRRLHVAGHSAGGHLTAMAMAARWPLWDPDLPADLVKGGIAVSGLYDLEPLRHARFLADDLRLDARSAERLSPAWMPPATDAPLITAVGSLESAEFHRQNALIGQRWARNLRADIPAPGRHHLSVMDALAEPGHPLFEAAAALCLGR